MVEASSKSQNSKRIAKNTLVLYVRMFFTMAVSIYTSRVILHSLGIEDYGIYNVVGGLVGIFSMLSNTLAASIVRYINYAIGKDDADYLKKVFSTSINIQVILAVVVVLLAETVGLWFLYNKMIIPDERFNAAFWCFQISVLTFVINLLSVPYNSAIIAHEKMSIFAYISIFEVSVKLFVAFVIVYNPFDRLIYYALLLAIAAILVRLFYAIYCKRSFVECKYHFVWEKGLVKEMLSFAGWNMFGASANVLMRQGVDVLLNMFFGPAVNAAKGVANQVNAAIHGFVSNFQTALNPQIMQNYASGNKEYMMYLVFKGTRLCYYILLVLSLPVIFTTDYILSIWLMEVPEHTALFVRLILILSLSDSLAGPLVTAMVATGKIRNYQIVVGGIMLLNIPISYVTLKIGCIPEIVLVVAIFLSVCCEAARLIMLKPMIGLSIRKFLREVYFKALYVTLVASVLPYVLLRYLNDTFLHFVILFTVSFVSVSVCILYLGCEKGERAFVFSKVKDFKTKFIK